MPRQPAKKLKAEKKKTFIGCSGYYYPQWREGFYPKGLAAKNWLNFYSSQFNSVELNGTFYRVPKPADLKKQYQATEPGFKFSVKMSRYVTHILRLKNSAQLITEFTDLMASNLSDKLHKILFQLPPSFHFNNETFEAVLSTIPDDPLYVVEFRHASWWCAEVHKAFEKRKTIFCNIDFPGLQPAFTGAGKDFYLRLHGVPELFKSPYSEQRLAELYSQFPACNSYTVYFNNTYYGAAYQNARFLRTLMHP